MSMSSLAKYEVKTYDSDEHEVHVEYGICKGKTYTEVAEELEEYYGADNICHLKITLLQEGPAIINKGAYEKL